MFLYYRVAKVANNVTGASYKRKTRTNDVWKGRDIYTNTYNNDLYYNDNSCTMAHNRKVH